MKKTKKTKSPSSRGITLLFAATITLTYVALSKTLIYIPTQPMMDYGFAFFSAFPGIITYSFVHISPMHLIGNLLLFIPVGLIAEKKLRSKDFVIIYALSAGVAAITFSALVPETILVGASAAVSGLIAAAFMVDIKKAFAAVIASSLLIMIVSPYVMDATNQEYARLKARSLGLEQTLTDVEANLTIAVQSNDTAAVIYYSEVKNKTIQEYNATKTGETNLEVGLRREKAARTSPWVHLAGTLAGFAYLFVFRRDIIWEMPSQVTSLRFWQKN